MFIIFNDAVDDGSGVLGCTQWRVEEDSDRDLFVPALGQLVSVWGRVCEYRAQKELTVSSIVVCEDPNAEPMHWLEVTHLKRTVYSRPFSPPPGVLLGEVTLEQVVEYTVAEHLRKSYSKRHFSLRELAGDAALVELCEAHAPTSSSREQVLAELTSCVTALPQRGVVFPAVGIGKQREARYEVCRTLKSILTPSHL